MPRLSYAKILKANEAIAQMYERSRQIGHPQAAALAIHDLLGGTVACTMHCQRGAEPLYGMSDPELGAQIYGLPGAILARHPLLGRRRRITRLSEAMSGRVWREHEFHRSVRSIFHHRDELGVDIALPDAGRFSICLMRDRLTFSGEDEELLRLMLPHLSAMIGWSALPALKTSSAEPLDTLSRREREVAGWVAEGKTNDELAKILGISPLTVKRHLENCYRKLGVENRFALISLMLRGERA